MSDMREDMVVTPGMSPVILSRDNHEVFFAQLVGEYQGVPYAELAVLLSWDRALATVHQTHHWEASGDPFYGDHKLYEELYNNLVKEVDMIAEHAVGLGCTDLVCPCKQTEHMVKVLKVAYFERPGIPQSADLAERSLHMEQCFLKAVVCTIECLEGKGQLTPGVNRMLEDVAYMHEKHCYLLKQRRGT